MTRLVKFFVAVVMIMVAGIGVLAGLYFAQGSLELYPTAEQQSKIRYLTGGTFIFSCVLEYVLWKVFRRLHPSKVI